MTREEKQLLFIDLCARLPYGIIVKENDGVKENDNKLLDIDMFDGCINYDYIIEEIKPYLRPMSSMTDKEVKELVSLGKTAFCTLEPGRFREIANPKQIDWLNAHHFDYRELIDKGLALEAPNDMYK